MTEEREIHSHWQGFQLRPLKSVAIVALLFLVGTLTSPAQPFQLPTANHALFEKGGEERFFAPTPGKVWTSGCFGCVRSEGWQLHEGLDILCLQRDKRGEPTDPVMASADGKVVYINKRSSLSNYGLYIILQHQIEGMQVFTIYAHLRSIQPDLKIGQTVKAGETIATLGRTSNTSQGISKDRAHVHFEIDLFINERFGTWYKRFMPKERNDHSIWNGQNLSGLDPRLVLESQHFQGTNFSLLRFIQEQTPLCRVLVRDTDFPWLKRYPMLVKPNPVAAKEGVAGYEIALNYTGLPFELIPRAASEIKGKARIQLLSVNEAEQQQRPCRKLVTRRSGRWQLAYNGTKLLELLVE